MLVAGDGAGVLFGDDGERGEYEVFSPGNTREGDGDNTDWRNDSLYVAKADDTVDVADDKKGWSDGGNFEYYGAYIVMHIIGAG